jgi:hypothetical protein
MMTQQATDHGERNLTWLRNTPNLRRNDKDGGVTVMEVRESNIASLQL